MNTTLADMKRIAKTMAAGCVNAAYAWALHQISMPKDALFPAGMMHTDSWLTKRFPKLRQGYRTEADYQKMMLVVNGHTMVTYDGQATLIDQVRFVESRGIAGAFVELGTWKGGCMGLMAQANLAYGKTRRVLHGFDSFAGLPAPIKGKDAASEVCDTFKVAEADMDGSLKPIGALLSERSDVERLLARIGYPEDQVHLHVGWFQDTVPPAAAGIGPIAILRLDGDLYDSYKIGLETLWDSVVPGGFVIFDDWVFEGCRKAILEFFAARGIDRYVCRADATVRYVQKSGQP